MRAVSLDACGCFPTGRHYAGIAHLLRAVTRGLVEELAADGPWAEMPIVLLDVETTGKDPSADRVIEVGIAVARGGAIVHRRNWLVNPGRPIPKESTEVHKITDDDVKDAPPFEAVAAEVHASLAGASRPRTTRPSTRRSSRASWRARASRSGATSSGSTRSSGRASCSRASARGRSPRWRRAWASPTRTRTGRARTPRQPSRCCWPSRATCACRAHTERSSRSSGAWLWRKPTRDACAGAVTAGSQPVASRTAPRDDCPILPDPDASRPGGTHDRQGHHPTGGHQVRGTRHRGHGERTRDRHRELGPRPGSSRSTRRS